MQYDNHGHVKGGGDRTVNRLFLFGDLVSPRASSVAVTVVQQMYLRCLLCVLCYLLHLYAETESHYK